MIIAEYTLEHPFLRHTLNAVPGINVEWEDSYSSPDGQMQTIVWVESNDFEIVDATIADDPTVANPTVLTEVSGKRLYRFDLSGDGAQSSIMPIIVEVGGVHQELTATADGWRNQTRFPDRAALQRVYSFCREHGVAFTFHRIYDQTELYSGEAPTLTDAQVETLREAVECGYLDIPRKSSLEELGDRLGVSESAASERFRRATKGLIEQTVTDNED